MSQEENCRCDMSPLHFPVTCPPVRADFYIVMAAANIMLPHYCNNNFLGFDLNLIVI